MNPWIEGLLQPISPEQPCGPDLSYDARLDELQSNLNGKPEVEIGNHKQEAEPPDWQELKDKSAEFLGLSKHLRVAVMLCCSLLKIEGLPGFRDGLQLIEGLLERFWPNLYPSLDPDDNNDPTQRLNILSGLTAPRGLVTGWLTIIEYLYMAPLCRSNGAPAITLERIQAARRKTKPSENVSSPNPPADAPDQAQVEAAMRRAGMDQAAAIHQTVRESLESIQAIDRFLTTTLGAGNTISFEVVQKTLEEMLVALEPFLAPAPAAKAAAAPATHQSSPIDGIGISVTGSIRSREDVVRAIDGICEYYRQVEPSSPVPFVLRRAQKLALMNFVQAVQELNLASIEALRPSIGSGLDGTNPGAGSS